MISKIINRRRYFSYSTKSGNGKEGNLELEIIKIISTGSTFY